MSACPGSAIRSTGSRIRARRGSTSSPRRKACSVPTSDCSRFVADVQTESTGRRLPVNGAGAGGALLVDLGVEPDSVRGFVLIARTAGLVAHLAEEARHPIGLPLWLEIEERVQPLTDT